jgi:hypothetical protein
VAQSRNPSTNPLSPSPVPVPDKGKSQYPRCTCDVYESLKGWRRLYPVLLSFLGAGIIAIAVHSCSVAREAGNLESALEYTQKQQREQFLEIKALRTADSNLQSSVQGDQSQVLIQLGRMEEKINGMSSRLEQVEKVLIRGGQGHGRYGGG